MNTNKALISRLVGSDLFQRYQQAYTNATGMPLILKRLESEGLTSKERTGDNPLCHKPESSGHSCAECVQMQDKVRRYSTKDDPATALCVHGLAEAAVPLRLGDDVIGYLYSGQFVLNRSESGRNDEEVCYSTYPGTPIISEKKFIEMVSLLHSIAELLSLKSSQLMVTERELEHPVITRVKRIIQEHYAGVLTVGYVAREVRMSPFHLCKLFRKYERSSFTECLSRLRTEKAKELLLKTNIRVGEIVFAVGFQSLAHFNRVFKKIVGESPAQYREQMLRSYTACEPAMDLRAA